MSPRKKEILYQNKAFRLTARKLKQGDSTAELVSPTCLQITRGSDTRTVEIPTSLPQGAIGFHSSIPLLTAVYALAVHELYADITPEGHLCAGAAWSAVWTRDIAYAAALGANLAAPEATKRSLEARVRDGIIMQDTGTGGGWPISTDRVSWALGAWAYYLSSGDQEWLSFCIDTLKNTLAQDAATLKTTPLIPGETSFLDWREQSYPSWMSPADIGATYAFGTNVLHYLCRRLLARMLETADRHDEAQPYLHEAAALAEAIERNFWRPSAQQYSMALGHTPDTRTDTLATALAVLSGISGDHAEQALRALPRTPYGTPVFSPAKADIPDAYHNRAIWPFAEAFLLLAHAEVQDIQGMEFSMACLLRAALLFGTNKENLHSGTGEAADTIQNSDRQLWSVAGMLGLFYHGLLGIQYEHDSLVFNPCIPESFAGSHWFTGLRIRDMVLDIHLNGYGTDVCSVMINGKAGSPVIPLDTKGHVQIELEIMPAEADTPAPAFKPAREDLPTPRWAAPTAQNLAWERVPGAKKYRVYANGVLMTTTAKTSIPLDLSPRIFYREFQVQAYNDRTSSCLSEPFEYVSPKSRHLLHPMRIGEHAEYSVERQQAWLDTRACTQKLIYEPLTLSAEGTYRLRIHYCNATASLRDGDTCALRELRIDDTPVAIVPLPHNTEQGRWEDYSFTAPLKLRLSKGEHIFSLVYTPDCTNSNQHINQCMVRFLELTRVS